MIWGILGFISGVVGGMGLGGGTVLIPLLVLFANSTPEQARLTNLIAFIPAAAAALLINRKKGVLHPKHALGLLPYAVLGAVLGMLVSTVITTDMLRKGFGVLLVLLAVSQWVRAEKRNKAAP